MQIQSNMMSSPAYAAGRFAGNTTPGQQPDDGQTTNAHTKSANQTRFGFDPTVHTAFTEKILHWLSGGVADKEAILRPLAEKLAQAGEGLPFLKGVLGASALGVATHTGFSALTNGMKVMHADRMATAAENNTALMARLAQALAPQRGGNEALQQLQRQMAEQNPEAYQQLMRQMHSPQVNEDAYQQLQRQLNQAGQTINSAQEQAARVPVGN